MKLSTYVLQLQKRFFCYIGNNPLLAIWIVTCWMLEANYRPLVLFYSYLIFCCRQNGDRTILDLSAVPRRFKSNRWNCLTVITYGSKHKQINLLYLSYLFMPLRQTKKLLADLNCCKKQVHGTLPGRESLSFQSKQTENLKGDAETGLLKWCDIFMPDSQWPWKMSEGDFDWPKKGKAFLDNSYSSLQISWKK